MLFLGGLIGLILFAASGVKFDHWWVELGVNIIIDICAFYFAVLLSYIWWKPPFLEYLYRFLEFKIQIVLILFQYGILLACLAAGVFGLIQFLNGS